MPQPLVQNLSEQLQDIYNGLLLDAIDEALASQKQELIKRFEGILAELLEKHDDYAEGFGRVIDHSGFETDIRSKLQELGQVTKED